MPNRDLSAAWDYHIVTRLSTESSPLSVDWSDQPLPYKIYPTLPSLRLPHEPACSLRPALAAIAVDASDGDAPRVPDLSTLTTLLQFSAGIIHRRPQRDGVVQFRAASCTGALYHVELYIVCGPLPGLDAGVYHFAVPNRSLKRLRHGDFRDALVAASGAYPAVAVAPLLIVTTSTIWRNAWRYRERTYRHCFWDTGTVLANLLALANAHGLPAEVVIGFVDAAVNRLLDIDGAREVALSITAVGRGVEPSPPAPPVGPLDLPTMPISAREAVYPAIRAMHAASSLATADEVRAWRVDERSGTSVRSFASGALVSALGAPIDEVIRARGSTRRFARSAVALDHLLAILGAATSRVPADFSAPDAGLLNDLFVVLHAVEGMPSGAYQFHPDRRTLRPLAVGDFRDATGALVPDAARAADAAVNVYLMAPLPAVLERFGNRGYRAAQLEAGIILGRLYLAAHALGLGATGLTFYDDAVIEFFAPHADGRVVMLAAALGRAAPAHAPDPHRRLSL